MSLVPFTEDDYLATAREQYTQQLKSKENFDKYVQLLIHGLTDLQGVFKDLLQKRSIDEATGTNLDNIGAIVGQPRELINADLFNLFGFQGAVNAGSFGDTTAPAIGSKFWDIYQPQSGNVLLEDETYRLFIKAKIIKNSTAATPEEFISFINFVFGTDQTFITEGVAEFTVFFGRQLTDIETVLLNYISYTQGYPSRFILKPAGVRISFGQYLEGNYFGFQGAIGANGFGDLTSTYGFDQSWGLHYGDSDRGMGVPVWTPSYDGSSTYDGTNVYNSTASYPIPGGISGGYFASLL